MAWCCLLRNAGDDQRGLAIFGNFTPQVSKIALISMKSWSVPQGRALVPGVSASHSTSGRATVAEVVAQEHPLHAPLVCGRHGGRAHRGLAAAPAATAGS